MTLVFSLLPEAGIILLLEFYDPNWVNFDHFICQIDLYSGLKIDPEFRVKYVDPGFRVNLTRFASVAYIDQDPGHDLTLFGLNLTRMFLECRSSFRRGIVVACLNINSPVAHIDKLYIALKLMYYVLMRRNSPKLLAITRSVYRVLILLEEIEV